MGGKSVAVMVLHIKMQQNREKIKELQQLLPVLHKGKSKSTLEGLGDTSLTLVSPCLLSHHILIHLYCFTCSVLTEHSRLITIATLKND